MRIEYENDEDEPDMKKAMEIAQQLVDKKAVHKPEKKGKK